MAEGTKLGPDDLEFEKRLSKEKADLLGKESKATKIGELSEFEKELFAEGSEAEDDVAKPEEPKVERVSKESKVESASGDDLFEKEVTESVLDYQEGDIVKGIVRQVEKTGVLVDIRYKSDGFIPNSELSNDPPEMPLPTFSPGDEIDVYIEKLETREGYTALSRKRALYETAWNDLNKFVKTREPITVRVTSKVEGGLVAEYEGIKGFIPASHVTREHKDSLESLLDQDLAVLPLNVDRRRRKVIFSHRLAEDRPMPEEIEKLMNSIEVGEVRKGRVTSIKDFGAFVDIGGIEGLVHISELSWARVNHPSQVLAVDDEVDVFVLGVDKDNQRISLGMKQLQTDPWAAVHENYKIGQIVEGTITRLVSFGAFMQIEKDLEGLIHISELANNRVAQVSDVVNEGDKVIAKVVKLLPEEQKIGLSLKALDQEAGESVSAPKAEKPAAEGEKPAVEGEEPAAEDEKPAAEGEEPAVEGEEPAAEGEEPAAEIEEPAAKEDPSLNEESNENQAPILTDT